MDPISSNPHALFRKRIVIFGMLFFVLVLIVTGLFWFFYFYRSPNAILLRSLSKIQTITSFEYLGTVKLTYGSDDSETLTGIPLEFTSGFVGSYNANRNEQKPRVLFSGTVNASEVTMSEFDARSVNGTLYLYIKRFVDIGFLDTEKILNQWIAVRGDSIPPQLKESFALPFWEFDTRQLISTISEEPITVIEVLPETSIDGMLSYHYRYRIEAEKLYPLFTNTNFNVQLFEFDDGEVWIGKDDERVRAITFTFRKKSEEKGVPEITLSGNVSFKNINTPIQIETPQSFILLDEILSKAVKPVTLP